MLPPTLPLSAVPITAQQDPIRQRPDIPPVVPVQQSSNETTIDLQKRDPEEAALLLREEQRRQQERDRRRREADEDPEEHLAVPGTELNADNTVPVVPLVEGETRQGLWVDIQI
ncbi:aspartate-semialdehyde dehydrogenase [Pseudomonas sp. AF32]|uniref:aspartate-semialdehyde dehydrogenase n=1 Tax=Pseudomonas sp. AF32 TaxID=554390 RepID=UPI001EEE7BAC|nr:aspartate-semialdehyde dehydrogenase [Pseudomonas sp. AF32]MCG6573357.1 aspartate-semialdehyde dehydrogenase [Pseudomonas sp. AF32]